MAKLAWCKAHAVKMKLSGNAIHSAARPGCTLEVLDHGVHHQTGMLSHGLGCSEHQSAGCGRQGRMYTALVLSHQPPSRHHSFDQQVANVVVDKRFCQAPVSSPLLIDQRICQ